MAVNIAISAAGMPRRWASVNDRYRVQYLRTVVARTSRTAILNRDSQQPPSVVDVGTLQWFWTLLRVRSRMMEQGEALLGRRCDQTTPLATLVGRSAPWMARAATGSREQGRCWPYARAVLVRAVDVSFFCRERNTTESPCRPMMLLLVARRVRCYTTDAA